MSLVPASSHGGSSSFIPARNVGQMDITFSETITAGEGAKHVTFAYDAGDASMVDLTDPTYPKIVTAGIYAFTGTVIKTPTSTDEWIASMTVDDNFHSVTPWQAMSGSIDADRTALATTWWCDATDPFYLEIFSASVSGDQFNGGIHVQRIA